MTRPLTRVALSATQAAYSSFSSWSCRLASMLMRMLLAGRLPPTTALSGAVVRRPRSARSPRCPSRRPGSGRIGSRCRSCRRCRHRSRSRSPAAGWPGSCPAGRPGWGRYAPAGAGVSGHGAGAPAIPARTALLWSAVSPLRSTAYWASAVSWCRWPPVLGRPRQAQDGRSAPRPCPARSLVEMLVRVAREGIPIAGGGQGHAVAVQDVAPGRGLGRGAGSQLRSASALPERPGAIATCQ